MQFKVVRGSLHSHGCWTDYRNPNEMARFPFSLEAFVRHCISCKRDFQAVTDIMTNHSRPEFTEHRYYGLLRTASPKADYELEAGKKESVVHCSGKEIVILRSQEVLTARTFQHILVFGAEKDIRGGRLAVEVLKEARELGAYAVLNHPLSYNPWVLEEILSLHEQGLICAIEWNSGNVLPSFMSYLSTSLPSKSDNARVLMLGKQNKIPVIANDDSHTADDLKRGSFTSYEVDCSARPLSDRIFEAITKGDFTRHEKYCSLFSPFVHFYYGKQSQRMFGKRGIPNP